MPTKLKKIQRHPISINSKRQQFSEQYVFNETMTLICLILSLGIRTICSIIVSYKTLLHIPHLAGTKLKPHDGSSDCKKWARPPVSHLTNIPRWNARWSFRLGGRKRVIYSALVSWFPLILGIQKHTKSFCWNTTLSTAAQENHSGERVQMKAVTIQDLSISARHESLTNTL